MSVYNMLQSPLDSFYNLDKIVDENSKNYSMYKSIVRANCKDKIYGKYNENESNQFYLRLYYDWYNNLLSCANRKGVKQEYKEILDKLINYLNNKVPSTKEDVIDILSEDKDDEELNEILNIFRWNNLGEDTGWNHIASSKVKFGTHKAPSPCHRIYINCDSTITHKLARLFVEKCNDEDLTYYFKFDDFGKRDDNFVIYSDSENLEKYVMILKRVIKEEHLASNIHRPPICTSTIDDQLGYGSDPEIGGDVESFNQNRSDHLEKCFNNTFYKWIENRGKEHLINTLIHSAKDEIKNYIGSSSTYKGFRGYTKEDLDTEEFYDAVNEYMHDHIDNIMDYYKTGNDDFKRTIPFVDGYLKIDKDILNMARKKEIKYIYSENEDFRYNLKNEILSTCEENGIDKNNYGCNLYLLEDLKKETMSNIVSLDVNVRNIDDKKYHSNRRSIFGFLFGKKKKEEEEEDQVVNY
ncbi:MAG: hypothetical protein IKQ06_05075 [Bacilli bacterium]|nr:hypothetical protein [Bacilli bacterium]MBR6137509.1 hypothetical protein [Bacilli bacterium]